MPEKYRGPFSVRVLTQNYPEETAGASGLIVTIVGPIVSVVGFPLLHPALCLTPAVQGPASVGGGGAEPGRPSCSASHVSFRRKLGSGLPSIPSLYLLGGRSSYTCLNWT